MNDAAFMSLLNSCCNLHPELDHFLFGNGATSEPFGNSSARYVFHHYKVRELMGTELINRSDIGVIQFSEC